MSWKATAAVKELKGVTRSEKLLLLILADYHNDRSGQCNPKVRDIAEDALMGERRVQQLLSQLHDRGVIVIEGRQGGAGKRAQYWLSCIGYNPEKYAPFEGEEIAPLTPKPSAPLRVKSPTKKGEIPHTALYEEPQLEPQIKPETEPQEPRPRRPAIFVLFEQSFGRLFSQVEAEEMRAMEEEYPAECVDHAFREAAMANARNLRYVKAICRKHKERGDCLAERVPAAMGAPEPVKSLRYSS